METVHKLDQSTDFRTKRKKLLQNIKQKLKENVETKLTDE